MEIGKRRNTKVLFIGIFCVVTLICYIATNTQRFKDFWDAVCYRLTDFQPYLSHDVNDAKLLLWTRKNKKNAIYLNMSSVPTTNFFNISNPIKVLIHGFSDQGRTRWIRYYRDRYLEAGDVNVISVEWSLLSSPPWYSSAAKNARKVGYAVAQFILKLKANGVSLDKIHVLGASLGAQVAGIIGYFTNGQLGRITGLDPSGLLFHFVNASDRLDKSDAQFVDIIHSAGRWVGNDDILGHVDFFPNSGRSPQPGCIDKESVDLTCSHFMAIRLFEATIVDGGKFIAVLCNNFEDFDSGICCNGQTFGQMGENVDPKLRGKFYLNTKSSRPFSLPKDVSINCKRLRDVI